MFLFSQRKTQRYVNIRQLLTYCNGGIHRMRESSLKKILRIHKRTSARCECTYLCISLAAQTVLNQIVTKLKSKSIYAIQMEQNQAKWKNTLNKLRRTSMYGIAQHFDLHVILCKCELMPFLVYGNSQTSNESCQTFAMQGKKNYAKKYGDISEFLHIMNYSN